MARPANWRVNPQLANPAGLGPFAFALQCWIVSHLRDIERLKVIIDTVGVVKCSYCISAYANIAWIVHHEKYRDEDGENARKGSRQLVVALKACFEMLGLRISPVADANGSSCVVFREVGNHGQRQPGFLAPFTPPEHPDQPRQPNTRPRQSAAKISQAFALALLGCTKQTSDEGRR